MKRLSVLIVTLWLAGCASVPPPAASPDPERTAAAGESRFEISYVRGNNLHRFVGVGQGMDAWLRSYHDTRLLKESRIDRDKYLGLFKQAIDLVELTRQSAGRVLGRCRTPFLLKVKPETEAQASSVEGCRAPDDGGTQALAKLLREVERYSVSP